MPYRDASGARGDRGGEGGEGGDGSAVGMSEAPEVGVDPVIEKCMVHLRKENWLPEIVAGYGPLPRRRRPEMESAEAFVRPRGRGEGMSAAAKARRANFGCFARFRGSAPRAQRRNRAGHVKARRGRRLKVPAAGGRRRIGSALRLE